MKYFYRAVQKQEWLFVIVHTKTFGLAVSLLTIAIENIRYDELQVSMPDDILLKSFIYFIL